MAGRAALRSIYFRPADLALTWRCFLQQSSMRRHRFSGWDWAAILLVRDGGIRGVVIAAAGIFNELERVGDQQVRAGTSLPCTQLAQAMVSAGAWDHPSSSPASPAPLAARWQ